ncbi:ferritin-like domain-containing protein [Streptomyces sclerotialus]|uniref:ferritin-like domain-containing protein n=1 Tax=Streptomyces sclerotialus TaxID=1957 RepID=UPI0007C42D93
MVTGEFAEWTRHFTAQAEWRERTGDPDWARGARAPGAVWRSLQRFQVGEDGDGANLIGKADAAGDGDYAAAVRLFVAEERNHARLLARLLAAGGRPVLASCWSDRVFVRLRRLLGMRTELLVLMVAELVAVRYYRAVRDGAQDPLVSEVAALILADERRHIPFHCRRLRASLDELPGRAPRVLTMAGWRALTLGAAVFVALDHGAALRRLGVRRARFVAEVRALTGPVVADVLDRTRPLPVPPAGPVSGPAAAVRRYPVTGTAGKGGPAAY